MAMLNNIYKYSVNCTRTRLIQCVLGSNVSVYLTLDCYMFKSVAFTVTFDYERDLQGPS